MSTKPEEDDEEDLNVVDTSASSRRAFFAGRDFGRAEAGSGLESAAFRALPTGRHGGSQTVKPEDTLGSMDVCGACGGPFDHDWPGKALGVPHPRTNKEPVAMTTPSTTPPPERIQRKQLRGYHADVADVVITAVNQYGVKFAIRGSKLLLYPPDGTNPLSVRTGSNEGERKRVQAWFVRHCVPEGMTVQDVIKRNKQATVEKVDQEVIKELAETMNSEEHLPPVEKPAHPKPEPAGSGEPPSPPVEAPPLADEPSEEWVPYYTGRGKGHRDSEGTKSEIFVTNGVDVRCIVDGWVGKPAGTGGHTRTRHRPTDSMWGPEARAKAYETKRMNTLTESVAQVITQLQEAVGIEPAQVDTEQLEKAQFELRKAQEQVKALRLELAKSSTKVVELGTEVTNLKAKVALLREAFTALEE
jgi:hypothetical protein